MSDSRWKPNVTKRWTIGFGPNTLAPGETFEDKRSEYRKFVLERIINTGGRSGLEITSLKVGERLAEPPAGFAYPIALTAVDLLWRLEAASKELITIAIKNTSGRPKVLSFAAIGSATEPGGHDE